MRRKAMRRKPSMRWGVFVVAACVVATALPGCELLVDFDRSKIPQEGGVDATSGEDGTTPGMDSGAPEAASQDSSTGMDSASDAPATDSGAGAPPGDGATDSAADSASPTDSSASEGAAADTGADSPVEAAVDSEAPDAPAEASEDSNAPIDSGADTAD